MRVRDPCYAAPPTKASGTPAGVAPTGAIELAEFKCAISLRADSVPAPPVQVA